MANLVLLKSWMSSIPEVWLSIQGFEGYEVSNRGQVRSFWFTHGVAYQGHAKRLSRTRSLGNVAKPASVHLDRCGYARLELISTKRRVKFFVHRLVAQAFLGTIPKSLVVNHKNAIKTDNRLENLEYVTVKENTMHAHRLGLGAFGERQGSSKLTDDKVRDMRRLRLNGQTLKSLSIFFKVSINTIDRAVKSETWRHVR